jgi:prolyl-tRNA editing enzyme YbaK/EbsC (Cys-tRNA(Pro) deacylase)
VSAPLRGPGTLAWGPALERPDLLAPPVAAALDAWEHAGDVLVAEIDPGLADTAALVAATGVPAAVSANCVVVAGRRGEVERVAAALVLATTRADVNGLVRRALDARKASFLDRERAVGESGMEFGGITPVGLPARWRLLVDEAVTAVDVAVVGSGVRRSKLALPGALVAELPGAEVVAGLGAPLPS